jgi:uroporphyrinogen decarboxylase
MHRYQPLLKDDVIKALERKKPSRIPLVRAKWWGEGLEQQYGSQLKRFDCYDDDVIHLWIDNPANPSNMDLSWDWDKHGAHDTRIVIDDWQKLDEFIENLPDPEKDPQWEGLIKKVKLAKENDRYLMMGWWRLFFEQPWELRGMQNLILDHLEHPDKIHRLNQALCDSYLKYIQKMIVLFEPDGFWSSDDLGHQNGPMLTPPSFQSLLLPYYKKISRILKKNHMHFWLHSCGDNSLLMDHLIEGGVDVFHPVQKHTMDEAFIAEKYGEKISFLAGFDVQHTLIEGSPDMVRAEVQYLIDTFDRPEGGMCIGAGNGIVANTPLENIEVFLDEAYKYGEAHRRQFDYF